MSLFDTAPLKSEDDSGRPLADRMRPRTLDEFVGQDHILAPGKPLRTQIESGQLKAVKIGKKTVIRVDDAEKWLAALKPVELNESTRANAVSRHRPKVGSKSRLRP